MVRSFDLTERLEWHRGNYRRIKKEWIPQKKLE